MDPQPQNIKIISTNLPVKNADSYSIFFSYTYDSLHHPFICERVLKREALIKYMEKESSETPHSPIICLLTPDALLVADISWNGISISKRTLGAATVFKLSSANKNRRDIPGAMQVLSLLMDEFNRTLVYRGESRLFGRDNERTAQPIPKIFRKDAQQNFLYALREAFLFADYQHRFYEPSFNTSFQWLADMQHFGMPTRLLDVTKNFLTALYFACQEDEYDGVLFSYSVNTPYVKSLEDFIKNFWCDIATLADMAQIRPFLERKLNEHLTIKSEFPARVKGNRDLLQVDKKDWITKRILVENMDDPYKHEFSNFITLNLNSLFDMIFDVYYYSPLHVTPPAYLNQRAASQSGEFLLFPGKICFDDNQPRKLLSLRDPKMFGESEFKPAFIPLEWKPLLRGLLYDKFNVNEGTIYPDKEHIVSALIKRGS